MALYHADMDDILTTLADYVSERTGVPHSDDWLGLFAILGGRWYGFEPFGNQFVDDEWEYWQFGIDNDSPEWITFRLDTKRKNKRPCLRKEQRHLSDPDLVPAMEKFFDLSRSFPLTSV